MTKTYTQSKNILPTVALVGRVNVGKSTLFNRLIEEQKAIISDIPGTTRTNNEGLITWRGELFRLIDTGGLTFTDDVPFEEEILEQSKAAMKQAHVILFVTDAQTGVLPQEYELAKHLRRIEKKPVILIANKADSKKHERNLTEQSWYKLGLGEPFALSAANGRNTGDLLDIITDLTKEMRAHIQPPAEVKDSFAVALIGKPNVGKSSLFNKLIGEEKVIVSNIEHTTREPHDTDVLYQAEASEETPPYKITFIDTAGIRRKARVGSRLERESIHKSIDSVTKSDIILFVVDGTTPISTQDMQLGGLLERHAKSVLVLLNKWDLAEEKEDSKRNEIIAMMRQYFPHLSFAPILLVSGKTGYSVHKIFPELIHAWQARHIKIPVKALEAFLKAATATHAPSRGKGTRHPKLMGIRQIGIAPPVFEVFVKYRTSVHRSYLNYLENRLREQFDFYGVPIIIKLTKMKR
ncbi:MAG: ribosome biogenesis GTPase Der [Candidatus Magasanikbacteria bacterium CG10_big_fil_rev_8_21_14_0_10_42_10]|uniref:GTPase Der n=2 Tax=Candidatus Magasanikiibacteriota TaxID=1752731 RepID=A0A2H0TZG8_9BACT|nr:MAG: ribosome biogenesis GTPase Der [Candidatus Magasanikbacteria bacterium CG10_big_fil_rev_8_21_14_0_10_42_10]PIZ94101.1 MAG: ribosome biogenesis GTPase Der [Candidatus Magasanikbacteria bacterium CG_4_10_14_0_2_um_filter_41_10]